jgi:hypothetical protein
MRNFLMSVVATGLLAGAVLTHPAAGKGGGGKTGASSAKGGGAHSTGSYHLTHGTRFSGGYSYKGVSHNHWTHWGYSKRYGCTCYWCPSTHCYYYWCQSAGCYYPVSYFASAPYTTGPVLTQTPTQTQGLPDGVPPIPQ